MPGAHVGSLRSQEGGGSGRPGQEACLSQWCGKVAVVPLHRRALHLTVVCGVASETSILTSPTHTACLEAAAVQLVILL